MILTIPIATTLPFFDQTVNLDGTDYLLTFRYNQREARYFLTIGAPDGTVYTAGAALVCDFPLFSNCRDSRLPPGRLFCQASGPDRTPPALGELGIGKRVELVYYDAAELA